jgi:hypothetical protein
MLREAGMQVSPVTMSHPFRCSTLFTSGNKRLTKGDCQVFAFGFLMGKACWCGRLLEGKRIAEGGKRIAEGNC